MAAPCRWSRLAASAALVAGALATAPARADDSSSVAPPFALRVRGEGGLSTPSPRGAVNAVLARTRWNNLLALVPSAAFAFGVESRGAHADVRVQAGGSSADYDGPAAHYRSISLELGYRIGLPRRLSITPEVGVSALSTLLCFTGHADAGTGFTLPAFEQTLLRPGFNTCLRASSTGVDVGLAAAWHAPSVGGDGLALMLSIGPEIRYSLALSQERTWTRGAFGDPQAETHEIDGPVAPFATAFAGLQLVLRFAVVRPRASTER